MARPRRATPSRAHRRVLRLGIIQGGRIIEERLFREHCDITIGQAPRNSFIISSTSLPRTYRVFQVVEGRYILNFAKGMDGRITIKGRVRTLSQARDMGAARHQGDWWQLPLEAGARGKLVIGDVTLLFQFVKTPPVIPQAKLPATIQGTLGSQMDPAFTMVLAACVALAAAVWITFQVIPKPKIQSRPARLRQLVKSQLEQQHKKPPKPMKAVKPTDDDDDDDAKNAAKKAAVKAAGGPKKPLPGKGKILKKGSKAYKRTLEALTSVEIDRGDDKFKHIALAGKCRTEEECAKAIQGEDPLARGGRFGSLDDRASSTDTAGAGGGPGGGPGGHRSGKRSLVGPQGGGPIGVRGTGTRGGTMVRVMRPMPPPMMRTRITPFVPPPSLGGGAGAKVRAKIRSRVYGLKTCYNRALISNPKLQGAVRISFMIMANGRLSSINVASAMGGLVTNCIRSKVTRWHLGSVPSQVFYQFSVRFSPGG